MAEAGTLDRQTEEKHADTSIITEQSVSRKVAKTNTRLKIKRQLDG